MKNSFVEDEESGIAILTMEGEYSGADLLAGLSMINSSPKKHKKILIDMTQINYKYRVGESADSKERLIAAEAFIEALRRQATAAIALCAEKKNYTGLIATNLSMSGIQASIFFERDEALGWLKSIVR